MPSTSEKQRRLMAAAAHNAEIARRTGIPQTVAREYNHADHLRELHRAAKSSPTIRTNAAGKRRSE